MTTPRVSSGRYALAHSASTLRNVPGELTKYKANLREQQGAQLHTLPQKTEPSHPAHTQDARCRWSLSVTVAESRQPPRLCWTPQQHIHCQPPYLSTAGYLF